MEPSIVPILQTVLVLPALAIVGGITAGVVKMILQHVEKKAVIKTQSAGTADDSLRDDFEALRQEVARLRDTSTQYDISIQHTLDDLQYRVSTLESRKRNGSAAARAAKDEEANVVINRQV
jgi:hypothetical protein